MLKKIITFFFAFIISVCSSYAATTLEANYTLGEAGWNMQDAKYGKANSLRDLSGKNHGLVNWGGAPDSSLGATNATPALASTASITAAGGWANENGSDSLLFGGLTRYVVRFDVKMTDVKNQILWSIGDASGDNGLVIKTDDNGILSLAQYRGSNNVAGSSFTMTKDTWARVVMYVNDNVATLYVNGSKVLSYTATNATLSKMKFCAVDGKGASATSSVVDELSIWKFDEADTFASVWQTVNAHRLSDSATIPATPEAPATPSVDPDPPAPPPVDPEPAGTLIDIINNDLIRNAQSNGAAKKNKNYTGGGLVIAGNSYADGVGQCAPAMMPLTIPAQPGKKTIFRGRVGVDDAGTGSVTFHILSGTKTLWSSSSMSKGTAAESFSVELPAGCTKVYLMTTGSGYANWVSLRYDYATDDTVYPVNPIILGEEFGITPDVESDQSAALANALDRLRACGGGTLSLRKGTYHFYVSGSHKMRFHVSNHEQTAGNEFDVVGVHPISIPLIDLRNVTLEGNGSTFIFHGRGLPWVVMDSENIEVKNIISDHKRMYYSEAKVVGKNGNYPIVTIDENEFPYTLSGGTSGTLTFNGGGTGEGETWTLGVGIYLHFQKYTDDSGSECYRIYPGTTDNSYGGGVNSVATVDGVKQLTLNISRSQIVVGDVLMLRTWARPHPGCFIYRSKDTVFNNVQIASAFGMAWLAQMSENILISGGGTFPRPSTGRVYSGCVDSTHFVNCKGQVTVENGLFCNMMDDAINVHNTSLKVTSKSGNTIVCNFGHAQAVGFDPIQVGDTIRFLDRPAMVYRDTAKVTAVEKTGTWSISLTLDRAVPDFVTTGQDAIENVDYQPNVTFSGSIIRGNRARGALFTSPRKVICENNKFLWVSGAAIQFAGDAGSWYESGGTRDAIVRGNVFDNCFTSNYGNAGGVITIFPTNFSASAQSGAAERYHQNIVIENNTFKTFQTPMLHSLSGSYLKFINNKVYFNNKPDGAAQPYGTNPFNFSYSDDILISGNRVAVVGSTTLAPQNWTLSNCTYSNTTNIVFDQPSYDVWSSVRFPSDTPETEKALDATPAKDEIINLEKFVFDATGTLDPTKPAGAFGRPEIFTTGAGTVDEKDYLILRFPYNSAAAGVTLSAECLENPDAETPTWTSASNKISLAKNEDETEIVVTLLDPITTATSKQAVRLTGTLDGKTFTTEPYGYELISVPAKTTTKFGLRVHKPFIFQKEISAGTNPLPFDVGVGDHADEVTINDTDLPAKIDTTKSYIVEILTEAVAGTRVSTPFIVNRNAWRGLTDMTKATGTVTFVCANLADYLSVPANADAIVGYRIREASTLSDVFGSAAESGLKTGTSRTADMVKFHILDKNLWSFWVNSRNVFDAGSLNGVGVNPAATPIFYHRPIQLQRRENNVLSFILTGEVLMDSQEIHVYKSDSNISSGLLFGGNEAIPKPTVEGHVQVDSKLR